MTMTMRAQVMVASEEEKSEMLAEDVTPLMEPNSLGCR